MRKLSSITPQEVLIVIALIILLGLILIKIFQDSSSNIYSTCENPEFVQTITRTEGSSKDIYTTVTYLYKCADGRMVESFHLLNK